MFNLKKRIFVGPTASALQFGSKGTKPARRGRMDPVKTNRR